MPVIGVTASTEREARRYIESIEKRNGTTRLILPNEESTAEESLDGLAGFFLTGGEDIHPSVYNEAFLEEASIETSSVSRIRDWMEIQLIRSALQAELPILCVCRGMQIMNVALGGKLIQDLPGHKATHANGRWESARHQIYLSPGSKLAAIIGMGGFFRVNSRHHQGLREAHRSPQLLGTAYALDDGIVEAVEMPGMSWVIGVQWHPEREDECSPIFGNLFQAFVERAATYAEANNS